MLKSKLQTNRSHKLSNRKPMTTKFGNMNKQIDFRMFSSISNDVRTKAKRKAAKTLKNNANDKRSVLSRQRDNEEESYRPVTSRQTKNKLEINFSTAKTHKTSLFNKLAPHTTTNQKAKRMSLFTTTNRLASRSKQKKWLDHEQLKKKLDRIEIQHKPTFVNSSDLLEKSEIIIKNDNRLLNSYPDEQKAESIIKHNSDSFGTDSDDDIDFNFFKKIDDNMENLSQDGDLSFIINGRRVREDIEGVTYIGNENKTRNRKSSKKASLYSSHISRVMETSNQKKSFFEQRKSTSKFKNRYSFLMSKSRNKIN